MSSISAVDGRARMHTGLDARMKGLLVSMAVVALMLAVLAPAAAAKPRLELEWDGPKNVHVGEQIDLDWSQNGTAYLPGAKFIVQEALPAGGYRTIIGRLKPTGPEFGEATLPAHKVLGKYGYRLAMVLKGKVIAQKKVTIGVFDHVPLSVLFADQSTSLGAGLYVFPGGQFRYMASVPITSAGEQTLFTVPPNSCTAQRSATGPHRGTRSRAWRHRREVRGRLRHR